MDDDRSGPPADPDIARVILDLVAARGAGKSICPSEAARVLAGVDGDWRAFMGRVRRVAIALAMAGQIVITRKGRPVDPGAVRGVIRLRQPGP